MSRIKNFINKLVTFGKTGKFIDITPHRRDMLQKAIQYVTNEKVPGDYFEFGVARGLSFAGAYVLAKKYAAPIESFLAFDSFEGFPELEKVDSEFKRFKQGEESWSTTEFENTLKKASVPIAEVEIYQGWFKDTLDAQLTNAFIARQRKASIVWIDCDLYSSTSEALTFIKPFLQNGTVVAFDDWYCYHADPDKGERRALKEFLDKNTNITFTEYSKFGIVGNSFIVTISE